MSIPENRGYHVSDIPRGEFGQLSKITEEYLELVDANTQGVRIMEVNELADLLGAVEAYASTLGFTLSDLIAMKERTASAFASGDRVARQVPSTQAHAVAPVDVDEPSALAQIGPVFDKLFVVATVRMVCVVDPVITRIYINTDEIRREHCWDIAKDLERLDGSVIWHYDTLLSALRALADGPTLWPHWSTCHLWAGTLKTSRVEKQVLRITLDTTKPPTNVAPIENLEYASIACAAKTATVIETDYGAEVCDEDNSDFCATPARLRSQLCFVDGSAAVSAKSQSQVVAGTDDLPVLQAPEVSIQGYTIQCIGDLGGIGIFCAASLGHFTSAEVQKLRELLASPSVREHKIRIQAELSGFTGHINEQVRSRYYASELHLAVVQHEKDQIWHGVCFIASRQEQNCAILIVPVAKRSGALGWQHYSVDHVSIMVPADTSTRDLLQAEELAAASAED